MPSPPHKGESQNDFLARCIKYLMSREGKTSKQAAGQCYGMWRQKDKVAQRARQSKRG